MRFVCMFYAINTPVSPSRVRAPVLYCSWMEQAAIGAVLVLLAVYEGFLHPRWALCLSFVQFYVYTSIDILPVCGFRRRLRLLMTRRR